MLYYEKGPWDMKGEDARRSGGRPLTRSNKGEKSIGAVVKIFPMKI